MIFKKLFQKTVSDLAALSPKKVEKYGGKIGHTGTEIGSEICQDFSRKLLYIFQLDTL
jgi:hypothetical protein